MPTEKEKKKKNWTQYFRECTKPKWFNYITTNRPIIRYVFGGGGGKTTTIKKLHLNEMREKKKTIAAVVRPVPHSHANGNNETVQLADGMH